VESWPGGVNEKGFAEQKPKQTTKSGRRNKSTLIARKKKGGVSGGPLTK